MVDPLSATELRNLPSAVHLITAGRAFGIGRTKSYELARAGAFPVPVLRLGNSYRVTRAALLRALGENPAGEPGGPAA
ncbi:MAG: DNA-binding protein [Pseudonocardiaceae bacterium]